MRIERSLFGDLLGELAVTRPDAIEKGVVCARAYIARERQGKAARARNSNLELSADISRSAKAPGKLKRPPEHAFREYFHSLRNQTRSRNVVVRWASRAAVKFR